MRPPSFVGGGFEETWVERVNKGLDWNFWWRVLIRVGIELSSVVNVRCGDAAYHPLTV